MLLKVETKWVENWHFALFWCIVEKNDFSKRILKSNNILETTFYLPASEASREVANLIERKNPHTPFYNRLFDLSYNQKQKPIEKSLQVWLPELFLEAYFASKTANLWLNNYPDLHHSQGGMKFATQISPLLNL